MSKPGPAPKPTALEIAQGRPGHRPINKREAKPDPTMPHMPPNLCHAAKAEWKRIARRLYKAGLFTYVDRAMLSAYCQTYGRWVEAEFMIDETGGLVFETPNGFMAKNPYVTIAKEARKDLIVMAREFGLTPSARSRIQVDTGGDGPPELGDLLFNIVSDSK